MWRKEKEILMKHSTSLSQILAIYMTWKIKLIVISSPYIQDQNWRSQAKYRSDYVHLQPWSNWLKVELLGSSYITMEPLLKLNEKGSDFHWAKFHHQFCRINPSTPHNLCFFCRAFFHFPNQSLFLHFCSFLICW